ncbi:hypothetical protein CBR_g18941 [Chara braunii]|uniref:pyruvate decarboxylase n=1 Tax=Chara braunii TaxID=69332 RepID=A0A388KWW1_CHABU|nr:hypothetical protein CBR_g18941 [Chara braunii]|eukprot:GBG74531.1 hypothetical protein CBR_g18941 [Chara braunii]
MQGGTGFEEERDGTAPAVGGWESALGDREEEAKATSSRTGHVTPEAGLDKKGDIDAVGAISAAETAAWSAIPMQQLFEAPGTASLTSTSEMPLGEEDAKRRRSIMTARDAKPADASATSILCSVGMYLSARLVEVGIEHVFAVPGDFNMSLLDEVAKNEHISLVSCCNELNAGYAAEGYARVRCAGAMIVTFNVGSFSALNAVAGAYAQNLPVVCITGSPNSLERGKSRFVHHSVRRGYDLAERRIYSEVTSECVTIDNPEDAPSLIDRKQPPTSLFTHIPRSFDQQHEGVEGRSSGRTRRM